jgi:plasmid stabilization system protein ParE
MKAVEWSDLAVADLEGIDDYWMAYSEESAELVAMKIERAAEFLSTMPAAGPILRREDFRKWRVSGTDYVLVYRIVAQAIEALRVDRGRQDWRPA